MPCAYAYDNPMTIVVKVDTGVNSLQQVEAALTVTNYPPFIKTPAATQTTTALNTTITYDVTDLFEDLDDRVLTYSASKQDGTAIPTWVTFSPTTKVFTINTSQVRQVDVNVTVTNVDGKTANQTFNIAITNTAPSATLPTSSITKFENITFTHPIDVSTLFAAESDPNQVLSFTASGVPTWLTATWDSSTISLSGTAPHSAIGTHNIVFNASDTFDFALHTFSIVIIENFGPTKPGSFKTSYQGLEGLYEEEQIQTFNDIEGNPLTYSMTFKDGSAVNDSSWASFNPTTRKLNILPTSLVSHPQVFTLFVTDGYNPTEQVDITININYKPKDNPAVVVRSGEFICLQQSKFTISKNILTDDDTIVSYTLKLADGSAPPGWIQMKLPSATTHGNFEFNGTYPIFENKDIEFMLEATDSKGLVGSANFFVQAKLYCHASCNE